MKVKKVYDEEFKKNTVQLILKNKMSLVSASKDLGVGEDTLGKWVRGYKLQHSPSTGDCSLMSSATLQDVKRLKRENEVLRQERDILKKALGIFSQAPKGNLPL